MDKKHLSLVTDDSSDMSVLKMIFDQHISESISNERVEKLFLPVLKMINDNKFERKPRRTSWWPQTMASVAAVAAVAIVAVFSQDGSNNSAINSDMVVGTLVQVPSIGIPLAGTPFEGHEPAGFAILPRVDDVEFMLICENNMDMFRLTAPIDGGAYTFSGVPDGTYRLIALLSAESPNSQSMEIGRLVISDEEVEIRID